METKKACSETFEQAFASNSSGCVRVCECGRTNYDYYNTWDWEKNELENLIAKAESEPEKYIGHDYSISTMIVNGKEIVMGCPCNSARPYEDFLISHACQIAKFLNAYSDELTKRAKESRVKLQ